ncbi:MAG: 5'-3' exonuclease H3TH domain-containing protein, partial [Bacteroidia bacterium]
MLTKDVPKKLFLLDAYALIYRAFFAFSNNPRISSTGLNTSAIFGFTNTLLEVLNKEKPTHIAVVFDTAAPTQRHTDFVEYKAHREEMPDDLKTNIPYIFKLLEALNVCIYAVDGYEADDVIGSLARSAEKNGFTTYMMTPDKDYGQLVDENTFIYKPARLGNGVEILDQAAVCKRWEIKHVNELIEILGLMGDSADNIPGIPGVGEKTAIKFIHEFGTIENLYKNTDKLKGKMKEKVEANKELAFMSKKLATIITDIPEVIWDEECLVRKDINRELLKEVLTELEFRTLAKRLLGEDISVPAAAEESATTEKKPVAKKAVNTNQGDLFGDANTDIATVESAEEAPKNYKTAKDIPHNYILVDTAEKRKELISTLNNSTRFCYDSETTSLDTYEAEIVGMSFAVKEFEAYYVPFPADQKEAQKIADEFKHVFSDESKTLIGQNIKYDLEVLLNYNIEIKNKLFDTMVAHFLIQPEGRHN